MYKNLPVEVTPNFVMSLINEKKGEMHWDCSYSTYDAHYRQVNNLLFIFQVNWLFWCGILISKTIVFVLVYVGTLVIGRRMDIGRAGIFAIFVTQSNDFALGYPISKLTKIMKKG